MELLHHTLEFVRVDEPQDPFGFRFIHQSYTLRTARGGVERFDIAWSPKLLAQLEAVRRPGRDPADIAALGEWLRRALTPTGWEHLGEELRTASASGKEVVLTVRSSAAELYALPWELLTVGASGQHLGELPGVLIRYEWPETQSTAETPSPRPAGGRLLLAYSAAGGSVPAHEHLQAITRACELAHVNFDPDADVLAHASPAALKEALVRAEDEEHPYSLLHLLAHGGSSGSTFGLILDNDGGSDVIDAGRLRQLIAPHTGSLRLVVLAACDSGNLGSIGNHLGSVAQALHRAGVASVIASKYPLSVEGSTTLTEALYRGLFVELHSLEQAFVSARVRLASGLSSLDWASVQLYARAADGYDTRPVVFRPYRGLLAFTAQERRFFFGRDPERVEVIDRMQDLIGQGAPRFLVVAGASGTGKSSVVLAGVVPDVGEIRAQRPGNWQVVVLRPGARPLEALATALAARSDPQAPLLLIVDQFEEIFTHGQSPAIRQDFSQRLWSLANGETGVHCVLTLRVDFLDRCGEIVLDEGGIRLDRVAYDESHRVFVAQMPSEQVQSAIEGPAARVGLELEPGLVDQLLVDVGNEPGALPLLQHALDHVWLRRRGRQLRLDVYRSLGGLVGALERDADQLLEDLDPAQLRGARRLLTRLVAVQDDAGVDTRRRVELSRLGVDAVGAVDGFSAILERLVEHRLVVRAQREASSTVEIAHEALVRHWETLRDWIEEDRDKLRDLEKLKSWVGQWEQHGTLLRGSLLAKASELVALHTEDVDDAMRHLVRRSTRQEKVWRLGLSGLAIVLALFGTMSLVLWQKAQANAREAQSNAIEAKEGRKRAVAASIDAERSAQRARDSALIAAAVAAARDDQVTFALGLLREVEAEDPALEIAGWAAFASELLRRFHVTHTFAEAGRQVSKLRLYGDGTRIYAASENGCQILNVQTGETISELAGEHVHITTDGRRIITRTGPELLLWDGESGKLIAELAEADRGLVFDEHASEIRLDTVRRVWDMRTGKLRPIATTAVGKGSQRPQGLAAQSPDGRLDALVDENQPGLVEIVNREAGRRTSLTGHQVRVDGVGFSNDSRRVITYSLTDGTAKMWDIRSGRMLTDFELGWLSLKNASFSADGRWFSTTSSDGTARIWSASTGALVDALALDAEPITAVDCSRVGEVCVTSSSSGIHRWTIEAAPSVTTLSDDEEGVVVLGLSPGGDFAVTGQPDGARLWDTRSGVELGSFPYLISAAAVDEDGARVLTADSGKVRLWDIEQGTNSTLLVDNSERIRSLILSRDGRRLVTVSASHEARVWDIVALDRYSLGIAIGGSLDVTAAAISDDGEVILTGTEDGVATIWDAGTGRSQASLQGHADAITVVRLDAPRRAMTSSQDGDVRVWDSASGEQLARLQGHEAAIRDANFSSDGRLLVTAADDGTARVWDTVTSNELLVLGGGEETVKTAIFTPDGSRVITTSNDRLIRVWDASVGVQLLDFGDDVGPVLKLGVTGDGSRIVSYSMDRPARVWRDWEPAEIQDRLWTTMRRCPSSKTRQRRLGLSAGAAGERSAACEAVVECVQTHEDSASACVADLWRPRARLSTLNPTLTQAGASRRAATDLHRENSEDESEETAVDTKNSPRGGNIDTVFVADTVFFAPYSDTLTARSKEVLDRAAEVLTEFSTIIIEIRCHTDNVEARAFGLHLSRKRCHQVRSALFDRGIDPWQLRIRAVGPDEPVATGDSAGGRAESRSVVFSVVAHE